MVTFVELEIPAGEFDVGCVFANLPGVVVELDRLVPMAHAVIPYMWVRGADQRAVKEAVRTHEAVRHVRVVDGVDGHGTLYRVEWSRAVENSIVAIADMNISLLEARGTDTAWEFKFRAESRDEVGEFFDWWSNRDIAVKLGRIYDVSTDNTVNGQDLSDAQYEALVLAYQSGYFDDPRRATLEEVAAPLGISRQALAERLRRGTRNLMRQLVDEK
jgi:predicted DNA binding protein